MQPNNGYLALSVDSRVCAVFPTKSVRESAFSCEPCFGAFAPVCRALSSVAFWRVHRMNDLVEQFDDVILQLDEAIARIQDHAYDATSIAEVHFQLIATKVDLKVARDEMESTLSSVTRSLKKLMGDSQSQNGVADSLSRSEAAINFSQVSASIGVASLQIRTNGHGHGDVSIDGIRFGLSQSLALTLEALSGNKGVSNDHMVAWKTVDEIRDYLQLRTGKRPTHRAIVVRIARLRKEVPNPFLIMTDSRGQYRFGLRLSGRMRVQQVG
jgi:hypothetical protein